VFQLLSLSAPPQVLNMCSCLLHVSLSVDAVAGLPQGLQHFTISNCSSKRPSQAGASQAGASQAGASQAGASQAGASQAAEN